MAHVEGASRLERNIRRHFYHPDITKVINNIVKGCEECQKYKRGSRQYGLLAPRDVVPLPWQEIHCDTVGPWKISLRGGRELVFNAMTIIDPSTNLVEIVKLIKDHPTSEMAAAAVENNWIARYPRPKKCITDQGSEFKLEFLQMLRKNDIKHRTSTSRNARGNAMIERIHQAIGNVLRITVQVEDPKTAYEAECVVEKVLATAMHACRCAANGTIGDMPSGVLAFHRDMFMDLPMMADILTLQEHRQGLVDKRLLKANASRISHDFKVNEEVLKKADLGLGDKMKPAFEGPYKIETAHTNGTVTIRLSPMMKERINIRRIKPFRRSTL